MTDSIAHRDPDAAGAAVPIVEMSAITKRFPGIVANDRIDLALRPGEVHVLLGENGAGKSTLIAILSGLQRPDEGEIRIDGQPQVIGSPRHAIELGISTVYQAVMLAPTLTVAENLALGAPWWRRPHRREIAARLEEMAGAFGLTIHPDARTGDLSLGEQQQVEIVRALMRGSRVLILDEATSMLTPRGVAELGQLMRSLVARGIAIVFISHKLKEALDFGDRISVLRLGRKVGEIGPERLRQLDHDAAMAEVVGLMFGQDEAAGTGEGETPRARRAPPAEPPVLEVRGLSVAGQGAAAVRDVDLTVAPGEILGIAGIDGNGQKQLAEAIAGQRPIAAGTILLDGEPVERLDVGARRSRGLRYVTDDRHAEGTIGAFPVATNLVLKQIGDAPFWRRGVERPSAIRRHAGDLVDRFDVRTPGVDTPVGRLSGGNIQKVLLARELSGLARVVIHNKPTYGLDVQNIRASRQRIREAAEAGVATILISTDLEELLELCDRIAVMTGGRIAGAVPNGPDARDRIGRLMIGEAA